MRRTESAEIGGDTHLTALEKPGPQRDLSDIYRFLMPFVTDIRTAYILFILSFTTRTTPTAIKMALLDRRDAFQSIFRDIAKDSYLVVRKILDATWEGVWGDMQLPLSAKVKSFGEQVLKQVRVLTSGPLMI